MIAGSAAVGLTVWNGIGGVRAVVPGEIYRSGQLSTRELNEAIDRYGIRSVLNLRGRGHGRNWYGEEVAACADAGVRHVTITFDIDEAPPRPVVLRFLEAIDTLERPILMHCNRGVDRTGWAAAVVELARGEGLHRAGEELSIARGHLCSGDDCPQHAFLEAYRRWLDSTGRDDGTTAFREWVASVYCPDRWNAVLEDLGGFPETVAPGAEIEIVVEAVNRGRLNWPEPDDGVHLGLRVAGPFRTAPGNPVTAFISRESSPLDLGRGADDVSGTAPGSPVRLELRTRLPRRPGRYLVQVDLVAEHRHWFSEMGWPGLIAAVDVRDREASPPGTPAPQTE